MPITQPGRNYPQIQRVETDNAVKHIKKMITDGEKCEQDLNSIRATLYVNFVHKATDGVQISQGDYNMISTHELMLRILQQYSQQLKQPSPVNPAKDAN